jgi:hypothetical protein
MSMTDEHSLRIASVPKDGRLAVAFLFLFAAITAAMLFAFAPSSAGEFIAIIGLSCLGAIPLTIGVLVVRRNTRGITYVIDGSGIHLNRSGGDRVTIAYPSIDAIAWRSSGTVVSHRAADGRRVRTTLFCGGRTRAVRERVDSHLATRDAAAPPDGPS